MSAPDRRSACARSLRTMPSATSRSARGRCHRIRSRSRASPGDDVASSVDFVRGALADPNQATFGAFTDVDFAAAPAGTRIRPARSAPPRRHRRHPARASPQECASRRRSGGCGSHPSSAAAASAARSWRKTLRFARRSTASSTSTLAVGDWNSAARRLYQELGFTSWGIERDALRVRRPQWSPSITCRCGCADSTRGSATPLPPRRASAPAARPSA